MLYPPGLPLAADQLSAIWPLPAVAVKFPGVPGGASVGAAETSFEGPLVPAELLALTRYQ